MPARRRSRHGGAFGLARRRIAWTALVASLLPIAPARAVDAIVIEAKEIAGPGWRARDVTVRLDVIDGARARTSARAARLDSEMLPQPIETLSIECPDPIVAEPLIACRSARLVARVRELGTLRLRASGEYRTDRSASRFRISDLVLAGGRLELDGGTDARGWQVSGRGIGWTLPALRSFASRWVTLPEGLTLEGKLATTFDASSRGGALRGAAEARIEALNLSNEEGTLVAENVNATLGASLAAGPGARARALEMRLRSDAGQALAGSVLLDLKANPLSLEARGRLEPGAIAVEELRLEQRKLLRARGDALVRLGAKPGIERARLAIDALEFPAAYTSLLQITLAATDFGALATSGVVTGEVEIAENLPSRLRARLDDLELADTRGKFFVADLQGELNWAKVADAPVEPSRLAWSRGGAYGLSGGAARLDFRARGVDFELLKPARIPVFDGALNLGSLALRGLGTPEFALDFEADIEPISMPLLCEAFGWPEFSGQLAGKIPAVQFRNKLLSVSGDLRAQVFGGTIVGSNLRLQDPLGPWPRLFADVRAQNLDLELVTRTFSIGTITGRLEGHILGLELFDWSPVAFDALLRTPPGDRSPKRISARAVGNLSNIGGGGGGVVQALQSGLLRFFDEYRYQKLGIRCRLRDDVCIMGGIEPAGIGYYIVKGSGIPRIDIIGNQGRVNWPQLVSQVSASMQSEGVLVR